MLLKFQHTKRDTLTISSAFLFFFPGPALLPLKIARTVCAMKADSGPCKAIHSRYHFNIETRQCEMFDYGGCEGNDNNFLTLEECQEKCIVKGQCISNFASSF